MPIYNTGGRNPKKREMWRDQYGIQRTQNDRLGDVLRLSPKKLKDIIKSQASLSPSHRQIKDLAMKVIGKGITGEYYDHNKGKFIDASKLKSSFFADLLQKMIDFLMTKQRGGIVFDPRMFKNHNPPPFVNERLVGGIIDPRFFGQSQPYDPNVSY